jgi:hypothetical protein
MGQQKHADAEPLLLAGYEGVKQRGESQPGVALPYARQRCAAVTNRSLLALG